jgi:hypothetical protein
MISPSIKKKIVKEQDRKWIEPAINDIKAHFQAIEDFKKEFLARKPVVYYAHPMGYYGRREEASWLKQIAELFPEHEIINPNTQEHDEAGGGNMSYYTKLVYNQCTDLVAMPYTDGCYGAGVAAEMGAMRQAGGKVWTIADGALIEVDLEEVEYLDIGETVDRNRELERRKHRPPEKCPNCGHHLD